MAPTTLSPAYPVLQKLCDASAVLEKPLRWCGNIGVVFFFLMVVITFTDVFLRYFLGRPLDGTVEVTGLMMAMIVFAYTGYAQYTKTHISMDIVTQRLMPDSRAVLEFATTVWSAFVILLCIFAMTRYGLLNRKATPILGIPYSPFIFLGVAGVALLFLALLRDTLVTLLAMLRQARAGRIIFGFILAAAPLLIAWHFGTHRIPGLSGLLVGVIGIIFLFALFFLGMPIGFALMGTGLLFVCVLRGQGAGVTMFGNSWFNTVSNYTWAPLMSFMLMGYACYYCRFGEDLYRLGTAWIGHMRGGLAIGSVVACTLFGAVVGDTLSGTIAMAAIALPEMRKAQYDDRLALGTLSCSGTIGALIPPSTTFILYGVLAEQSIGDLFMAGFLPGILCMLCFMAVIWLMVLKKPELAPRREKAPRSEQMASLKGAHRGPVHPGHRRHLRRPVHRHGRRSHRRGGHADSRRRHAPPEVEQLPQGHGGIQPLYGHVLHPARRSDHSGLFHDHVAHAHHAGQLHRRAGRGPHRGDDRHRAGHLFSGLLPARHSAHSDLRAHLPAHCQELSLGSGVVRRHLRHSQQHGVHYASLRDQSLCHERRGRRAARSDVQGRSALCCGSVRLPCADHRLSADFPVPSSSHESITPDQRR